MMYFSPLRRQNSVLLRKYSFFCNSGMAKPKKNSQPDSTGSARSTRRLQPATCCTLYPKGADGRGAWPGSGGAGGRPVHYVDHAVAFAT